MKEHISLAVFTLGWAVASGFASLAFLLPGPGVFSTGYTFVVWLVSMTLGLNFSLKTHWPSLIALCILALTLSILVSTAAGLQVIASLILMFAAIMLIACVVAPLVCLWRVWRDTSHKP